MITGITIYKRDSKGKVREWRMEQDGDKYRTVAGLQDGQQVTSEWTIVEAKNVGRANATTPTEQAQAEIQAHYVKKLDVDYHETADTIDTPKIFKPMLAANWDKRKAKIDYTTIICVQPKLDGIRCIATRKGMFSRKGKPIVALPHIIAALEPLFAEFPNATLDGELYNHDLREDFNTIVSMVRKNKAPVYPYVDDNTSSSDNVVACKPDAVQYHVYDLPSEMNCSFMTRFASLCTMLDDIYDDDISIIVPVETLRASSEKNIDDHYATFIEQGYEGGIIRLNGPYEQKRSNLLLKRKDFDDAEFKIIGFEEGAGNWSGVAKIVLFEDNDGEVCRAALKGKYAYCLQVLKDAQRYIGKEVTVQYFGRTPAGRCRFPVAKVLHIEERI